MASFQHFQPLASSAMSAMRRHGVLQGALVLPSPTNNLHPTPPGPQVGGPKKRGPKPKGGDSQAPSGGWRLYGWAECAMHSRAVHGALLLSAPWALQHWLVGGALNPTPLPASEQLCAPPSALLCRERAWRQAQG